jgi:hypothetical protein
MVDVVSPTCERDGCEVHPVYNMQGEKKGRFCSEHKEPGMVDVKSPTCEMDGCEVHPVYNMQEEKKGRFCKEHKEPGMVDVKNRSCERDGCEVQPWYNTQGEKKGRFCKEHKEPGMVDVVHPTCQRDGCDVRPVYNIRGEKKGRFCKEHKELGMIDVSSPTCQRDGCDVRPVYNTRGEKKGHFCFEHKETGMVNVKSPTCDGDGCNFRTRYGLLGSPATFCARHRQKAMIPYPTRKCCTPRCRQLGTHEHSGQRYCETHSPVDSINLGIATCTVCGLDDILTDGKCDTCNPTIIAIRTHAKEERIRDVFTAAGFLFIHDRILESTSCGRERPDFLIDCGTHYVIVEVDENQHQNYACECEQIRMRNIVEQHGLPIRWIRYNPDVYEPAKGQREMKREQRETVLLEYVRWAISHTPMESGDISNVLYLFYDEHDKNKLEWERLIEST